MSSQGKETKEEAKSPHSHHPVATGKIVFGATPKVFLEPVMYVTGTGMYIIFQKHYILFLVSVIVLLVFASPGRD